MDILTPPAAKKPKTTALDEDSFGIKAILSDEYKTEIRLIKVHSSQLESKQELQIVIEELAQKLPHFQHLKRVHDSNVLICPTADIEDTLEQHLKLHKISDKVLAALCRKVNVVEVPASWAKLRTQYEQMIRYWPCKFHPDKYAESLQNGSNFTASQRVYHKRMAHLLCNLSKDVCGGQPVGICVDPRQPSVVAIAAAGSSSNESSSHQHCVMWLVDHVARSQRGGAWSSPLAFVKDVEQATRTLRGLPQTYYDYLRGHTASQDLVCGAELPRCGEPSSANDDLQAGNLAKYGPYLCTGYDVYLLREPCLMCAMALVHSRVRRIFFLELSRNGALASTFQLHAVKELNHHYEVFQFTTV